MIRRRFGAVPATVVTMIVTSAAAQDPQRPLVFRARTTAVSLDVSVMQRNRPVTGLTAADFAVTDNGVSQTVEQVLTDAVPIDVTLIIDANARTGTIFDDIRRNTQRSLELLRPDDRARVLVIETHPYELLPLQTVDRGLALPAQPTPRGSPSLHDAILVALVTPPDPGRRRLVVAIAQGIDTRSITSGQSLELVARRTDTVLHVVTVQPPPPDLGSRDVFPDGTRPTYPAMDGTLRRLADSQRPDPPGAGFDRALGFGSLVRVQPPTRQETQLFETLPALTGGAFHGPGRWGRNVNVVAAIRDLIAEFRQSYVIQYTPRDVAPGGWHEVVVRVKGVNPEGVRTRAGYFDTVQ